MYVYRLRGRERNLELGSLISFPKKNLIFQFLKPNRELRGVEEL